MKKNIITALLIICAFFTWTYNAYADTCKVYIGDKYLDDEITELTDGTGGKVTFDGSTITMNNFDFYGKGSLVESEVTLYTALHSECGKSLKLNLVGKNTIKFSESEFKDEDAATYANTGLFFESGLQIEGTGELDIYNDNSKEYYASLGIYTINSLNIKNATIKVYNTKSSYLTSGIMANDGLLVEKGRVVVSAPSNKELYSETYGIYADGVILFVRSDIKVNLEDSASAIGVFSYDSVIINGSTLDLNVGSSTGTGYDVGIIALEYDISANESTIKAYSKNELFISSDGVSLNGTILELSSDTSLVGNEIPAELVNYDEDILVGVSPDGENTTVWDNETELTNYKYLKVLTKDEKGTVTSSKDNDIISINIDDLKNLITLSDIEKLKLSSGSNATIRFAVNSSEDNISEKDKILINDNLGKNKIGTYFDINIFKKVGDIPEEKVEELSNKIKLSFVLDEELINKNNKVTRTYKVMRVHNGSVSLLDTTYDKNTKKITFETDKFSSYVLLYQDTEIPEENPQTLDNISMYIITCLISLLSIITCLIIKKKLS